MTKLLLTDTHFGVKQNSITWLESQKDLIYKIIIPHINHINDDIKIIHLGDVFDSRSSISTMIAAEVVKIFKDLAKIDKVVEIIIINGNHDYYSPNSDKFDTPSLILHNIPKVKILNNTTMVDGDSLYVPWYEWANNNYEKYLTNDIKHVFTHADIVTDKIHLKNVKLYSGHIHIPYYDTKKGIYNLGSCYPLNFADANTDRGYYLLDDVNGLKFYKNTISIKFWRFKNEEVFDAFKQIRKGDYVELYISQSNLSKTDYVGAIKNILTNCRNASVIPVMTDMEKAVQVDFKSYDVESIARKFVPDNLKGKFEIVLHRVKHKDED